MGKDKDGYRLGYEDYEIDDLLRQVKDKTVYKEATTEQAGLLSAEDKAVIDDMSEQQALTNMEIEQLLGD